MKEVPDPRVLPSCGASLMCVHSGTMYIPCARERVEVAGQEGVFLVIAVDWTSQSADLIPVAGGMFGLEGVSFAKLRPVAEEVPRDLFSRP